MQHVIADWSLCEKYWITVLLELVRNLVAHGDAWEGKWRVNRRMEWVASTLTPPPNVAYPALLKLMRTPRLPAVDWTDTPADLNGLVHFRERRNLVSARVTSRSTRAIPSVFIRIEYKVSMYLRHTCARSWLASPPFRFYCVTLLSRASILILSLHCLSNHPAGLFVMTLHVH